MMAMFLNIQKPNVNTFLCKGFSFIVCNHVLNTSKTQGVYSPNLNLHKTCKLAQTCKHMWPQYMHMPHNPNQPFVPSTPNLHVICIWDPCMIF